MTIGLSNKLLTILVILALPFEIIGAICGCEMWQCTGLALMMIPIYLLVLVLSKHSTAESLVLTIILALILHFALKVNMHPVFWIISIVTVTALIEYPNRKYWFVAIIRTLFISLIFTFITVDFMKESTNMDVIWTIVLSLITFSGIIYLRYSSMKERGDEAALRIASVIGN